MYIVDLDYADYFNIQKSSNILSYKVGRWSHIECNRFMVVILHSMLTDVTMGTGLSCYTAVAMDDCEGSHVENFMVLLRTLVQ